MLRKSSVTSSPNKVTMVASLVKFSDATILRFAIDADRDRLMSLFDQWHPLSVLPADANLDIEQLHKSRWTVLSSSSTSDFGEFGELVKAIFAKPHVTDFEGVASFKLEEGSYFCKLSQLIANELSKNAPGQIVLATHLPGEENASPGTVSDDELQAALNRVNQKYANALQRLAE